MKTTENAANQITVLPASVVYTVPSSPYLREYKLWMTHGPVSKPLLVFALLELMHKLSCSCLNYVSTGD